MYIIEGYTVRQLKEQFEFRCLGTRGTKSDLYIRLQEVMEHEKNKVDVSNGDEVQVNPSEVDGSKLDDSQIGPEDSMSKVSHHSLRSSKSSISQHIAVEAANKVALKLKA